MPAISFLLIAIWITDCECLLLTISLEILFHISIWGIICVLKIILLATLKSASSNNIACNLSTEILLDIFSSIIETPFIYRLSGRPFLKARFTKSFLICEISMDKTWAL